MQKTIHRVPRTRIVAGLSVILGAALVAMAGAAPANAMADLSDLDAATLGVTYDTPGLHTFVVPEGVTSLDLEAVGAAGGATCVSGGSGSVVTGRIAVNPGDKITVRIGGLGGTATKVRGQKAVAPGGANRGGSASLNRDYSPNTPGAQVAGGGGSTEVFLNRFPTSEDVSRVIVAGGGGGAGACLDTAGGAGGGARDAQPGADGQHLRGGEAGALGGASNSTGAAANEGGGGGGGHVGGGAGSPGSTRHFGIDYAAGAGGGGAGTSWIADVISQGLIHQGAGGGDGSVRIVPISGVPSDEVRTADTLLLGDSTSELQHALKHTVGSRVSHEAGVLRRTTGQGDPLKTDNFRYTTGITPRGAIDVTIDETYPGGATVKREYEVYINNRLVHTRKGASAVAGVEAYSFTVDGSGFAPDQPLQIMIKNLNTKSEASIHQIRVATR